MKSIFYVLSGSLFLFLVSISTGFGAGGGNTTKFETGAFDNFLKTLSKVIADATVFFFFLAFALFVYGLAKYLILSGGDEEARAKGKSLMIWGVVAFFLISAIWGIAVFFQNLFGVESGSNLDVSFPGAVN